MRLLPAWLAAQPGRSFTLDGDASIRKRPIDRIAAPLREMGAQIDATGGRLPPFTVTGGAPARDPLRAAGRQRAGQVVRAARRAARGGRHDRRRARAQPRPHRAAARRRQRDDQPRGRRDLGHERRRADAARGATRSPSTPRRRRSRSPPACSSPGSRLLIRGCGVNWTRTGFLRILERMGGIALGDLERAPDARDPRRRADQRHRRALRAAASGTVVEPHEVPLAIDELPLVALLGCFADGETVVRGAQRAARSRSPTGSRPSSTALRGLGADIEATEDGFVGARHRRADGRDDRLARRSPARDARRGRRAWPRARASRCTAWRPPTSPTRASSRTSRRCAERASRRSPHRNRPNCSGSPRARVPCTGDAGRRS